MAFYTIQYIVKVDICERKIVRCAQSGQHCMIVMAKIPLMKKLFSAKNTFFGESTFNALDCLKTLQMNSNHPYSSLG